MSIIHVCYVVCDYTGCREKYELVGGTTKPDGWTASVAPKNERVGGYQDERNWCPNHAADWPEHKPTCPKCRRKVCVCP